MVLHLLEVDAPADHAFDIAQLAAAGGHRIVAFEALRVVLRLAVDVQRAAAGMGEEVVGPRLGQVECQGVVVDHLEFGATQEGDTDQRAVIGGMQLVGMHDIGGGDGAPVEMELGILVQVEGPGGEVLVVLPAPGEAAFVVFAGLRVLAN